MAAAFLRLAPRLPLSAAAPSRWLLASRTAASAGRVRVVAAPTVAASAVALSGLSLLASCQQSQRFSAAASATFLPLSFLFVAEDLLGEPDTGMMLSSVMKKRRKKMKRHKLKKRKRRARRAENR